MRSLDCELQSGSARRARRGRSSAGTRAEDATSRGTRSTASTTTSGRRLRLGHSRAEAPRGAERGSPGSCTGSAAALPDECVRIFENKVQQEEAARKQAQPFGQKMDQARGSFRRAVESGEKAMEALQKAQENFEQAQQEVIEARMDLDKAHARSAVASNAKSTVKTLEALTGIIEKMWNPDAGQPPDHLIHAIQEPSRMPGRIPNCGTWTRRRHEPRSHVLRGGAQPAQVQRLSARAMQNPRDTELLVLLQRACALIPPS